ncbi:MAG TPA: type II toxin-antitoxin system VapC family toxin [Phycisphaerae bacterium]|nr:type II toxin-antitoxin system VapC family toxin [Phycisphaerae bacterium]
MKLVADISVVLAWLFDEEHTVQALDVLGGIEKDGLLVPPLWWSELENGILMVERRCRKTIAQSTAFLRLIQALPIQTDDVPRHRVSNDIFDLARRHQLTAYDATYVELALREGALLATFDVALRRCAAAIGVKTMPAAI